MLAREFYFSRFSLWATWIFSGTKQQNKNDNKYILPFSEAFLCIAVGFQLTQFSILFSPVSLKPSISFEFCEYDTRKYWYVYADVVKLWLTVLISLIIIMYLSNVFSSKSCSSQQNTGVSVTRGPNTPEKRTTKISKNLSYLLKVFLISNCSPIRHFVLLGFFGLFVCFLTPFFIMYWLASHSKKKLFREKIIIPLITLPATQPGSYTTISATVHIASAQGNVQHWTDCTGATQGAPSSGKHSQLPSLYFMPAGLPVRFPFRYWWIDVKCVC